MIERMENVAARLIPHRKWILMAIAIDLVGIMPAAVGLMILFEAPLIFPAGTFFAALGFVWSWGLFLISYWYNPNGGPLTAEKIKTTYPPIRWFARILRYYAPIFLVIWFLCPFVVLAMLYPFMIMMAK